MHCIRSVGLFICEKWIKTFLVHVYTQNVHEQEWSLLMDDLSEMTVWNKFSHMPTYSRGSHDHNLDERPHSQPKPWLVLTHPSWNRVTTSTNMNWVPALATVNGMYLIGTRCCDEDGRTMSCFNHNPLSTHPIAIKPQVVCLPCSIQEVPFSNMIDIAHHWCSFHSRNVPRT